MDECMDFIKDVVRRRRNALEDRKQELLDEDAELQALETMVENFHKLNAQLEKLQQERDALKAENESLKMQQKELGQMSQKLVKKTEHEELLKEMRSYMNMSKRKQVKKRGYIKMVLSEMVLNLGLVLPDDMKEELDCFDDDIIKDLPPTRQPAPKEPVLSPLEQELMPIFFNNAVVVAGFVKEVNGASNAAIAEIINRYITQEKILRSERKKPLWTVLSRYSIYTASYDNFKAMVN